jgi:hypothetical protein
MYGYVDALTSHSVIVVVVFDASSQLSHHGRVHSCHCHVWHSWLRHASSPCRKLGNFATAPRHLHHFTRSGVGGCFCFPWGAIVDLAVIVMVVVVIIIVVVGIIAIAISFDSLGWLFLSCGIRLVQVLVLNLIRFIWILQTD